MRKKTVEKPVKPEKLEKKAQEPVKITNDKQEITSENVLQSRKKCLASNIISLRVASFKNVTLFFTKNRVTLLILGDSY